MERATSSPWLKPPKRSWENPSPPGNSPGPCRPAGPTGEAHLPLPTQLWAESTRCPLSPPACVPASLTPGSPASPTLGLPSLASGLTFSVSALALSVCSSLLDVCLCVCLLPTDAGHCSSFPCRHRAGWAGGRCLVNKGLPALSGVQPSQETFPKPAWRKAQTMWLFPQSKVRRWNSRKARERRAFLAPSCTTSEASARAV